MLRMTDYERECWDAMVSECPQCQERDDEEPCSEHDLVDMDREMLADLIAEWRAS